jgi:DNA repair exonuclease SbcCD nuclease subunit
MITIINDIHLGTQRQAGTTPASQIALKSYIQDEFRILVERQAQNHLIINGDLFDGFSVDPGEVIKAYDVLSAHLSFGGRLTLIAGNHDESAKGDKTSSFHLLAHILSQYGTEVQVVDHSVGFTNVANKVFAIPHMMNQDLFDMEIEKALASFGAGQFLLLHCNVMSPFAEKADHSLNLSEGQLEALVDAGWKLIVAHEHQMKSYRGGECQIVGNQIPTSVSDCLNNKNNQKFYAQIDLKKFELVQWLDVDQVYAEVDWQDISSAYLDNSKFIRVTGDCTAEQAADMVSRVSKLRQGSPAFVVSNAVKIEGVAQMEGLADLTTENISKFDVLGALLEELTEKEAEVVKELLK